VTESAASIVDLRLAGWPAACELQVRPPPGRDPGWGGAGSLDLGRAGGRRGTGMSMSWQKVVCFLVHARGTWLM
jgi:hypothetical protein